MCDYLIKGTIPLQDAIRWNIISSNFVMSKTQINFKFTTLFDPIRELRRQANN